MTRFSQSQGKSPMGCVDFWVSAQFWTGQRERTAVTPPKVVKPNNFTTKFDREAESGFCSDHAR